MLTAKHLRQAKDALRTSYLRGYPEAAAEVEAFLNRHIAELERQVIVFRPAGEGWEIGAQDDVRIYSVTPEILPVAHQAIANHEARVANHDLARRQIRRAARWAAMQARCVPLAQALRALRAASGVIVYDHRRPGAPHFITAFPEKRNRRALEDNRCNAHEHLQRQAATA